MSSEEEEEEKEGPTNLHRHEGMPDPITVKFTMSALVTLSPYGSGIGHIGRALWHIGNKLMEVFFQNLL